MTTQADTTPRGTGSPRHRGRDAGRRALAPWAGPPAHGAANPPAAAETGTAPLFDCGLRASVSFEPDAVAVGDLNGDGKLDLVTANAGDDTVSVLLNGMTDCLTANPSSGYPTKPFTLSGDNY